MPYCGDYLEANAWQPMELARYNYFLDKRKRMEDAEARNIRRLIASDDEQLAARSADDTEELRLASHLAETGPQEEE